MSAAVRVAAVLLLVLAAAPAPAAVTMSAVLDPPRLRVDEIGELSVHVEGADHVAAPAIPVPAGVSIRYVGPSTEVSIVDGRVTRRMTHRYAVSASKPGVYTLGPITVVEAGAVKDAGTVRLEVVAGGTSTGTDADRLALVLSTPRTEVYVHERLPLTVSLRVGAVRVADLQYPVLGGDGFAVEKLGEPTQRQEQAPLGTWQVVDFATTLTPLRAGTLTVGPATMQLAVLVRERRQDRFFGFFGETRRPMELRSEPLALTVLPLPAEGRPADFSGAVGRFEWEVRAAPLDPRAGDPVTVTGTIRGEGNLDFLTPPALAASDTLRVYPVQQATGDVPPGMRVYEQVVIPERAGDLVLPHLSLSYFDPAERAYRTITPAPIRLRVQPGLPREVPDAAARAGAEAAGETPLGQDIVFIKDSPGTLRPIGARLWRSPLFWAWWPVPVVAWAAAVLWQRRREERTGDPRRARASRAGREARAAIAAARARLAAHDVPGFNDAIARAVQDYLRAKLDLPAGGVSGEAVAARLAGRPRAAELAAEVREFLAACERARYTPASASVAESERTLARATAIVQGLERERRLGPPMAAMGLLVLLAASAGATEGPSASFLRAGGLYSEGRYADAARAYEAVRAAGVESANLYFNLGNAYFRAGDVGRAILNYERARRLAPSDPDVLANLAFARSRGAEAEGRSLLSRLLFPLADRVSTDRLLGGAAVAWTLLFLCAAVARLVPRARAAARWAAIACGLAVILLLGSGLQRLVAAELRPLAVVVSEQPAAVRFEPSRSGSVHFDAKPGALLRLVTEREGWAQVARADGRRGWIERDAVEPL